MGETEYDFDVAVTFAGEDRAFVEEIVGLVKTDGFAVFYDEDSKVATWGEDLTEYFSDVYQRRARYAVMFISADYAAKPWTRMERRSVLARALQESSPYLLPVRLDSTELPGVRSTVGYLDGHKEGAAGIADAIREKLSVPSPTEIGASTGVSHAQRPRSRSFSVSGLRDGNTCCSATGCSRAWSS